MILGSITNSSAGDNALSRFFTANTWNAQQIFKASAIDTPGAIFQSSGTISANPIGYGGSNVTAQFIASESSAYPYTLYDAVGNAQGHILAFRTSRGTYASRTATQSGDILGQLDFGGFGTSLVNGRARVVAFANQTWTGVSNGTSLEFYVTPSGQSASTLGFRLSAGTLLSGHNAEFFGSLFLKNAVGINFESVAGVSESVFGLSSANNVGISSPSASGGIILTNRATNGTIQLIAGTSTGQITLATGGATRLTIASSGLATFANQVQASELQINGAVATNRFLSWQTSGSIRWGWYANNDAEGSNAGSNLLLARYSDAGGLLSGAVITITRSNGNITTEGSIAVGRRMTSGVVALTDAATIALDASLGNHFRVTLAGNRTLNAPTSPTDGQYIRIEVIQDATGGRTLTLTTGALGFAFGTDIPSITLTTTPNLRDFIECVYNSTAQRWYVVRFVKGY